MSIPSAHVTVFRDLRADRYVDECTITRPTTTRGAINEATLEYDSEADTVLVTGQECALRAVYSAEADTIEFKETEPQLHDYKLVLPYDVYGIQPDDVVTMTTVTWADTDILGVPLTVRHVVGDTYAVAKFLYLTADLGPGKVI